MVLFVSSVLNPNGLEIAACLAFAACVLRIARGAVPSADVGLGGVGGERRGAIAWQLGPVFVIADLALGAALLGPERAPRTTPP